MDYSVRVETEQAFMEREGEKNFGLTVKKLKSMYRRDYLIPKLGDFTIVNEKQSTAILRNQLISHLRNLHPINEKLDGFTNAVIKFLTSKFVPNASRQVYDRQKRAIANFFFDHFPERPLTELQIKMNDLNFGNFFDMNSKRPQKKSLFTKRVNTENENENSEDLSVSNNATKTRSGSIETRSSSTETQSDLPNSSGPSKEIISSKVKPNKPEFILSTQNSRD